MIHSFLMVLGHHWRRSSGPLGLFSSLWCGTAAVPECQHTQGQDGTLEISCFAAGEGGWSAFLIWQLDHKAALPAAGQILPGKMRLESVPQQTSVRHIWILLLPCNDLQEGTQLWLLQASPPLPWTWSHEASCQWKVGRAHAEWCCLDLAD